MRGKGRGRRARPGGVLRSASSRLATASAPFPAAIAGCTTSEFHHPPSASAIRRVLSPYTRSRCSIELGRKLPDTCSSRKGTTSISSARRKSSGDGGAEPIASRTAITSSTGTPVRSLTSWNVSPARVANRSYAVPSRNSNERVPLRSAAATWSSGIPASSSDFAMSTRRRSPGESRPGSAGARTPRSRRRSTYAGSTPTRAHASSREYHLTPVSLWVSAPAFSGFTVT